MDGCIYSVSNHPLVYMIQYSIVIIIVSLAIIYALYRIYKAFTKSSCEKSNCEGCDLISRCNRNSQTK